MQPRIGLLSAASILVLVICYFEPSEQGPVKLLKRLGLLSHRQGQHHPTSGASHHTLSHQNAVHPQNVIINHQPDDHLDDGNEHNAIDQQFQHQHLYDEHENIIQPVDHGEDEEGIHTLPGNSMSVMQRIRHYVRVIKLVRGLNMFLDLGEFFRTYLE